MPPPEPGRASAIDRGAALELRIAELASKRRGPAFELALPDRPGRCIGTGPPAFKLVVLDGSGYEALASLDELRVGEAYLKGHIDIEGDLLAAISLRTILTDRHLLWNAWDTIVKPAIAGRIHADHEAISGHYENDPEFYAAFLDTEYRAYSHGYFEDDDEPLEKAIRRKLDFALDAVAVEPGARVLDVGAGWGAFLTHAGRQGIDVTSLTISVESERYVRSLIAEERLPCRVVKEHLLEHHVDEPYDAIVNLGVTEHLPDYPKTLEAYGRLLKPGGFIFLDASAARIKYAVSSFARAHVWPGGGSFFHLGRYVKAVDRSPFELLMVQNDRHNYQLTLQHWAENLDRNREIVIARWGEQLYRTFRLYLWGSVHSLETRRVTAYRWLMQLPVTPTPPRWRLRRS
jgi:cyclopropane-fatty-acyl-phospholipid synthase